MFCFGGSTTLGVPFEEDQQKNIPGQLQQALSSVGEEVEVINLGGASFGSDHVHLLWCLKHCNTIQIFWWSIPEITNCNHIINLEQSNQNWVYQGQPTSHVLTHIHTHLFPQKAEAIQKEQDLGGENSCRALFAIQVMWMFYNEKENDAIQDDVIARYLYNFKKIHQYAKKQRVPIIFVVVPSNLYTPPAISIHSPNLSSPKNGNRIFSLVDVQHPSCQKKLDTLAQQNPWYADVWYQKALCAQNHSKPHLQDQTSALNLDMLPGRPNQIMNEALLKSDLPLLLFDPQPNISTTVVICLNPAIIILQKRISTEIVLQWGFFCKKKSDKVRKKMSRFVTGGYEKGRSFFFTFTAMLSFCW